MPIAKEQKPLTNERQKELLRVVETCFGEFERRGQEHYRLDGMTTHHVVNHAIQDFTTLHAFWPKELIRKDRLNGVIYLLDEGTISKVQSSIRDTLDQLAEKGWINKVGNKQERRWRWDKPKPIVTPALDPSGRQVGTWTKKADGSWAFKN